MAFVDKKLLKRIPGAKAPKSMQWNYAGTKMLVLGEEGDLYVYVTPSLSTTVNAMPTWLGAVTEEEQTNILALMTQAVEHYGVVSEDVVADVRAKFGITRTQVLEATSWIYNQADQMTPDQPKVEKSSHVIVSVSTDAMPTSFRPTRVTWHPKRNVIAVVSEDSTRDLFDYKATAHVTFHAASREESTHIIKFVEQSKYAFDIDGTVSQVVWTPSDVLLLARTRSNGLTVVTALKGPRSHKPDPLVSYSAIDHAENVELQEERTTIWQMSVRGDKLVAMLGDVEDEYVTLKQVKSLKQRTVLRDSSGWLNEMPRLG